MSATQTLRWQRTAAMVAALLLMAFALIFRFAPSWLHLQSTSRPQLNTGSSYSGTRPAGATSSATLVGAVSIAYTSGPSLALASRDVILAKQQAQPSQSDTSSSSPAVERLLALAESARLQGNLVTETGGAAAFYREILKSHPHSVVARVGLAELERRLATDAQQALDDGDGDAATRYIAQLRTLPHSQADATRLAMRLRVLQRTRPLLSAAVKREKRGRDLSPAGHSAVDLYRKVLRLDPGDTVARRGLLRIQKNILDRGLRRAAQGNFAAANRELALAAKLVPNSGFLKAMRQRIKILRRAAAAVILDRALAALDARDAAQARNLAKQATHLFPALTKLRYFDRRMQYFRLYGGRQPGHVFADNFLGRSGGAPPMLVIPAGHFIMGTTAAGSGRIRASQRPAHEVTFVRGFAISRTEVTVNEFRAFTRATGYVTDAQRNGGSRVYDDATGRMRTDPEANWRDDYNGHPAHGDMPVLHVSWNDAVAYTHWLSKETGDKYHLPSEAQFEYAMRAGSVGPYWWGPGTPVQKVENLAGSLDRSFNGRRWDESFKGYGDGYWGPAPVMHFLPNPWGLFDMDGNVSEWIEDCWHENYVRAPVNGSAWINPGCVQRVVRGGSWASSPQQDLSSYRSQARENTSGARTGFRVARSFAVRP